MQLGHLSIPQNVTSLVGGIPGACATAGSVAFFWVYNRLITDPLRLFYFLSWWRNVSPDQICSKLTMVSAEWWKATPDRMAECQALLEREFISWEATVLIAVYFGLMAALVTWLLLRCCVINPIVRAIDHSQVSVRSPRMRVYPPEYRPRRALSVGTSPILARDQGNPGLTSLL